ncbi:EamA family transporter [Lysinibacillus sp. MHQ-1]|nr:EamA family transporter [Lysinibacillus sp. MHQ-1]
MIKVDGKTLKYAAIQGFLLFIVFALSLFGLQSTSVSNAGFILSLTVVLVPIFSSFIDKKITFQSRELCDYLYHDRYYSVNGARLFLLP